MSCPTNCAKCAADDMRRLAEIHKGAIRKWRREMHNLIAQHPTNHENLFSTRYRISEFATAEAEKAIDELCRQQTASVLLRRLEAGI